MSRTGASEGPDRQDGDPAPSRLERYEQAELLLLRGNANLAGHTVLPVHDRHLRAFHGCKTRGALGARDLGLLGERELPVLASGLDRERLRCRIDLDQLTRG